MATTLEQQPQPTGTRKYVDFDEFIEYQVNRTRSGIKHTDLLQAGVTVALVLTGYLLAFVVLDHWVIPGGFSYVPRALMLGAVLAFVVGWTAWKIVLPYLKRITALYAAKEIEQTRPELKSSLLTLVDLKRAGRRVPPHIVAAMEKRAAVNLSEMDVEQAVDRRPLMRLTYALFAVVVALCLYTVFSPKSIASSLWRALAPSAPTAVSTRTRIEKVEPGNAEVLARSQLEVTVDVSGEVPAEATLRFTTSDRSFVDEPIVMRDTGEGLKRFRGVLTGPNGRGLLQDFVYHIEAGDARSDDYRVTVQQAPYATVEEVIYEYPAYMKLAGRSQPGGEIDAWEGTQVTIRAVTNMPVKSGMILFSDTEDTTVKGREERLEVRDGTHLEYTTRLEFLQDGTYEHFYRLQVRTEDGKTDPVPRLYSIKIRRDLPPELKLLHPSGDVEMPANGVLPFAYEASDPDFMLRSVRAYFEKDEVKLEAHTRRLYESPPEQSRVKGTDEIDLSEFPLQPGETLTFWLEAWDNMEPLGAKLGNRVVTPKINITITEPVTPQEVQQQLDEQRQEAEQKLAEAQQAQNQPPGEQPETEPAGGEEPMQPDEGASPQDAGAKPPQPGDNPPQTNDGSRDAQQNQDRNAGEPGQERTAGGEQNPGAQPQPGEGTPQPSAQGDSQGTPDPTGAGERQPQPRGQGEQQPRPGERGSEQGGERQRQPSDANDRASDDSALQRLFNEYRDKIAQDRQQQQQSGDQNNADRQESNDPNAPERNSSSGQSQSDAQRNGDNNSTTPESSPGTSPREDGTSRSDTQRSPRESGSPNSSANPDRQPTTGQQSPTGDMPETMPDSEGPGSTPGQKNSDTQGKPGKTEGPGTSQSDTNQGNDAEARPGDVPPNQGERRPGTRDQQNTGAKPTTDGQGERTPTAEPNKNASQTGEKPEGEPSGDPATQPSEKPSQEGSTRKPNNTGGSEKPGEAQPAPEKDPDQSSEPGDRGSSPGDPMQTERPPARTGNQPGGPDDSKPGEGRERGQRAEQPSGGEQGSSQQASEGTKGGTQKGPGDASSQPGSQSDSPGQTGGKPGDKPGEGSQTQSGGDKPGGAEERMPSGNQQGGGGEQSQGEKPAGDQQGSGGKQGEKPSGGGKEGEGTGGKEGGGKEGGGKEGGGKEGGQQGGGEQGGGEGGKEGGAGAQGGASKQQGKESMNGGTASGGNARSGSGGGHDGAQAPTGEGSGGAGAADAAEEVELADKRRATELVLKRLEDELERGEVSDEMLKDLGWTEDNLRDFMQRLEQRLADSGEDQSPEAQARRNQFQEILRGIDYSSEGQTRSGGAGPRNTSSGFGAARRPAPAEFRRDQEAFKNRLSRETKGKK